MFLARLFFKKSFSNIITRVAYLKIRPLKNLLIRFFIRHYRVDLSEYEREKINDYQHFNDFFTRSLKKNARDFCAENLCSPVDGKIIQAGKIEQQTIFRAKDKKFSMTKLLAEKTDDKKFSAAYFAVFYLAPKNYHRIHIPCSGRLLKMCYVPGKLFSVNEKWVRAVDDLFAKNERLVCYFETDFGTVALVLVGAIFVGSIQTVWHGVVDFEKSRTVNYQNDNIHFEKGTEIGRFNMGSTVILLTNEAILKTGGNIRLGQSLSA